jgi:hypothetical protein
MKTPAESEENCLGFGRRFHIPSANPNYRGSNGASVGGVQGQSPGLTFFPPQRLPARLLVC